MITNPQLQFAQNQFSTNANVQPSQYPNRRATGLVPLSTGNLQLGTTGVQTTGSSNNGLYANQGYRSYPISGGPTSYNPVAGSVGGGSTTWASGSYQTPIPPGTHYRLGGRSFDLSMRGNGDNGYARNAVSQSQQRIFDLMRQGDFDQQLARHSSIRDFANAQRSRNTNNMNTQNGDLIELNDGFDQPSNFQNLINAQLDKFNNRRAANQSSSQFNNQLGPEFAAQLAAQTNAQPGFGSSSQFALQPAPGLGLGAQLVPQPPPGFGLGGQTDSVMDESTGDLPGGFRLNFNGTTSTENTRPEFEQTGRDPKNRKLEPTGSTGSFIDMFSDSADTTGVTGAAQTTQDPPDTRRSRQSDEQFYTGRRQSFGANQGYADSMRTGGAYGQRRQSFGMNNQRQISYDQPYNTMRQSNNRASGAVLGQIGTGSSFGQQQQQPQSYGTMRGRRQSFGSR